MKQVLISDILAAAKTNIVSFKELYVDERKEKRHTFHFLTKNAKLASMFVSVPVADLQELLGEKDVYFSILNKRVVEIDLPKAVGEFVNVASLENPFDLYEDMDREERGLITEFKDSLNENLSKGVVVLSAVKGAVFLDKEFLEAYLENGDAYELGLGDLGNAEILNCVFDSRLKRDASNIFICKNVEQLDEEVAEDEEPENFDEFDGVDAEAEAEVDVEEDFDPAFSSNVFKMRSFILNNAQEIDIVDEEDEEWEDDLDDWDDEDDSNITFKPEIKAKVSFDKESGKVSFSVENEMDFDRLEMVLEMNRAMQHFSKVEGSGVRGVAFGNNYTDFFQLRDLIPDLGHIPAEDYLSIVADSIAYNVIKGMASASVEIALDFSKGVNHCVHDFALDEFIDCTVTINPDDEYITVQINSTDNQKDYIGNHWSVTNLMKQSLLTWAKEKQGD